MIKNIAIDGLSGAGKSTVAKEVARELGYIYVDTGSMYRGVALYLIERKIDYKKEKNVINALKNIKIDLQYVNGEQQVILNGKNVSTDVRNEKVGIVTSKYVAVINEVREFLVEIQKELGKKKSIVMDGRDIGSVVLKDAFLKIYLDATPEARAKRRYKEILGKKTEVKYEEVVEDIKRRDYTDTTRKYSPLIRCEDAVYIDSSNMNIEEVVEEIIKIYKEREK